MQHGHPYDVTSSSAQHTRYARRTHDDTLAPHARGLRQRVGCHAGAHRPVAAPVPPVFNLRAFKEQADTLFTASRRSGLPLCALLVDIDHFKQINDTHGHATGDRVLQAVAQALKTALREADLCGRLGGEEFGVLLTGTNLHEALQLAEKLRLAIQAIVVPMDNTALRVTISVGVAEAGAACADITTLLAQADAAMYHAKANGRNRVHGGSA